MDYSINTVESDKRIKSTRIQQDMRSPGFRSLGINDTFDGGDYTIENLTIAFSANMAYGVYGKDYVQR